jgi:hypothetical protein
MYESGDGYEIGLKFIIASLKLIEAYDSEKHDELNKLLSEKVDISSDES